LNILIIDLYCAPATSAKYPKFLSHDHTIHPPFVAGFSLVAQTAPNSTPSAKLFIPDCHLSWSSEWDPGMSA
jgi:hypothetical protein